jgi:hypothetical protein
MEQLKLAWVYRFWIVIGVVALMPIVGYFVDTAKVARNAEARKRDLESTKTNLQAKLKGPFPNEKWVDGVNVKRNELSEWVDGAWIELYTKQAPIRTFPKAVEAKFLEAGPKEKTTKVESQTLLEYQRLFKSQYFELLRSIEAKSTPNVSIPNTKGLVEMSPALFDQFIPPWANDFTQPTNVPEAWLAQEDVWIVRAMMDVVKRANEGAESWSESRVKRIMDIRRGPSALDESVNEKTARLDMPDDIIDPGAVPKEAQAKLLRYINKEKIYKPVPVYMHLHVDQKHLLPVLAQFGNSDVPMVVKQVEVSQHSESPPIAKAVGKDKAKEPEEIGEIIRKDDEYFQMTDLKVYAWAFLYLKPPKLEEEEKAAKAKAESGAATQPTSGAGG